MQRTPAYTPHHPPRDTHAAGTRSPVVCDIYYRYVPDILPSVELGDTGCGRRPHITPFTFEPHWLTG